MNCPFCEKDVKPDMYLANMPIHSCPTIEKYGKSTDIYCIGRIKNGISR